MNVYEKPIAEVIDFAAEQIMDGGVEEGFSMNEGNEPA